MKLPFALVLFLVSSLLSGCGHPNDYQIVFGRGREEAYLLSTTDGQSYRLEYQEGYGHYWQRIKTDAPPQKAKENAPPTGQSTSVPVTTDPFATATPTGYKPNVQTPDIFDRLMPSNPSRQPDIFDKLNPSPSASTNPVNPYDRFDPPPSNGNVFDQFDKPKPKEPLK